MASQFLEETNQDFREFRNLSPVEPRQEVIDHMIAKVRQDLNPNSWQVFGKMAGIHFLVALGTLSICPQFGIRLLGDGLGVMRIFLSFGAYACSILCGAFFVGCSLFVSSLVLRGEEVKVLRRQKWLQISAISFLSLGAFIMSDAEIVLSFGLAWAGGSLLGGALLLELGQILRIWSWRIQSKNV